MVPRLALNINHIFIRLIFMKPKHFQIYILVFPKKKETLKLRRKLNMSFLLVFITLLEARLSLFILHYKKTRSQLLLLNFYKRQLNKLYLMEVICKNKVKFFLFYIIRLIYFIVLVLIVRLKQNYCLMKILFQEHMFKKLYVF